jgi:hypothetical protein
MRRGRGVKRFSCRTNAGKYQYPHRTPGIQRPRDGKIELLSPDEGKSRRVFNAGAMELEQFGAVKVK